MARAPNILFGLQLPSRPPLDTWAPTSVSRVGAVFCPLGKVSDAAWRGRPPFAVETMLRVHFMQQWFTLSDPAMEEALHDVPLFREFAGLNWSTVVPDETTILRFRRLLEEHKLAPQILAFGNELFDFT